MRTTRLLSLAVNNELVCPAYDALQAPIDASIWLLQHHVKLLLAALYVLHIYRWLASKQIINDVIRNNTSAEMPQMPALPPVVCLFV
jgi:hypothetical protein